MIVMTIILAGLVKGHISSHPPKNTRMNIRTKQVAVRNSVLASALAALLSSPCVPALAEDAADAGDAAADDPKTLEAVKVKADQPPASAVAPAQASLDALQPQSELSDYYLRTIAPATADYLTLVEMTPSSTNSTPNGAGLSSKNASVRGFQDGEYNVTFDGIPFGDPNSFGHATTSFFPASSLGRVVVDRGPGTASTLGNATFGGNVALYSSEPTDEFSGRLTALYGSGNTSQETASINSGVLNPSGTKFLLNASHAQSDGLIDYAGFHQSNLLGKLVQPLGENWTLSAVASVNRMGWNNFSQASEEQTRLYGKNYARLDNDPTSQNYASYNKTRRNSDFEYLRLQRTGEGIRFDNRLYTYSLDSHGYGGVERDGSLPSSYYSYVLTTGGVPGGHDHDYYRAWGDMASVEVDLSGTFMLRTGLWLEKAKMDKTENTVDLSTGEEVTLDGVLAGYPNSEVYNYSNTTYTHQYFVEAEWHPTERLTLVPGIKHVRFQRSQRGVYEWSSADADGHYQKTLGLFSANYRFMPDLSGYLQVAQGYQAPQADALQSKDSESELEPQQTVNYQSGLVWKRGNLVADFDVYYIDFKNKISSRTETSATGSDITVYYNAGGVIYKGIEAELTYRFGESGFSLYGNGSLNSAKSKETGYWIANAARSTANVGLIYDRERWFGSLMTKYVGRRYAGDGEDPDNPNDELPAYNYTNFNAGYRFDHGLSLRLAVNNLFDHRTATEGSGDASDPTYYYLPQRNYSLQVSFDF